MKKLMSALLVGLMSLGLFGVVLPQPVEVQASNTGPFKDFDVSIGDNGEVVIDSEVEREGQNPIGIIIEKYKGFIKGVAGIAAVTMLAALIIGGVKYGMSGDNPSARKAAMDGLKSTFTAMALLGSVSFIASLFYNLLN